MVTLRNLEHRIIFHQSRGHVKHYAELAAALAG
jgi:hypothetical protein